MLAAIRKQTFVKINACPDPVLILHDAAELDSSSLKSLTHDLTQIGNGGCRGYICQNVLAVNGRTGAVLGLVDQVLHKRAKTPKKETKPQLRARDSRESLLWLKGTKYLGQDSRLMDVCDRGADTFEFLERESNSGRAIATGNCIVHSTGVNTTELS